jgi:hypothetical protein
VFAAAAADDQYFQFALRRATPRRATAPSGGSDDTQCGAWGFIFI